MQLIFVLLSKKGNIKHNKFCTIVLVSHTNKLMLGVILDKMRKKADMEIPDEQVGFCRGMTDHITSL